MKTFKLLKYVAQLAILLAVYHGGWFCYDDCSWGESMPFVTLLICCGLCSICWETYQELDSRTQPLAKWFAIVCMITVVVTWI